MIRHFITTIVLVAIFAPSLALAQSKLDAITLMDGTSVKGTLSQMTKTEVTVEKSSIPTKIPVNKIKEIAFSGSLPYRSIVRFVKNGNYEDALNKIKDFDKSTLTRKILVSEIDAMTALCKAELAATGSSEVKRDAVSALKTFITANPNSYHYFDFMERLGDLQASQGDFKSAETSYTELARSGWPEYKLRAALLTGEMLLLQGQYKTAEQRFDLVIANTRSGEPLGDRQKLMATLNKAQCMAATNRGADALKMVDKVIAENDPADGPLFAKAYLAKGSCFLKIPNKTKEAALAYLHVDVLYFAQASAHAEALYHLGKIWTKLNKPQRSIQARQTLKKRYSGSSWAQQP